MNMIKFGGLVTLGLLIAACGEKETVQAPPTEVSTNNPAEVPVVKPEPNAVEYQASVYKSKTNGEDSQSNVPAALLSDFRDLDFDLATANAFAKRIIDESELTENDSFFAASKIAGYVTGRSDISAETFHEGVVFVYRDGSVLGLGHELSWNADRENYEISVTPQGFTYDDIQVLARGNVREEIRSVDLTTLSGFWEGDTYVIKNLKGQDSSSWYTVFRVTLSGTGEVIDFWGPDNFQAYK